MMIMRLLGLEVARTGLLYRWFKVCLALCKLMTLQSIFALESRPLFGPIVAQRVILFRFAV